MPPRRARLRVKLLAALLGLGLFMLLAELGSAVALRLLLGPAAVGTAEEKLPPQEVWMARDEKKPRAKDWYRYRIVCLGDSCTYGIGQKTPDSYPAQLEAMLNAGAGYRRFEVVNLGIAGYTSALALRRLREMALEFKPDLVIVSVGLNDKWRSELSDVEKEAWERSASNLWRHRLSAVLERSHVFRLLRYGLGPVLELRRTRFANLSVEYRVPLAQYRENMRTLAREARAAGSAVLFFNMAETPAIASLTQEGIAAYEKGNYKQAADKLQRCADIGFMYYPRPLYYLAQAYEKLGDQPKARRSMREARQLATVFPFPHRLKVPLDQIQVRSYLDGVKLEPDGHFDIYARYRQALAEVSAAEKVPYLDMTDRGMRASDYFDYCHLVPKGYEKVAAAVAELARAQVLPAAGAAPAAPTAGPN